MGKSEALGAISVRQEFDWDLAMIVGWMTGFVRQLVKRLLADDCLGVQNGLSRNRHFEVFEDSQGRSAQRIYRRLRQLIRDIQAAHPKPVALDRHGGDRPMRLRIPLPGGVRTAYLTEEELELLLEAKDFGGRVTT
jgi:hypothetical protein